MSAFSISADVVQNVAREKMLSGFFEDARVFLSECLFGISEEQIDLIIEGDAKLIDVPNGMDIVDEEDVEYKTILKQKRESLSLSETEQRKQQHNILKTKYQKDHIEFVSYQTEDRLVYFPQELMDSIITSNTLPVLYENLTPIEQLDLLINSSSSDLTFVENLIRDVKVFGYQFFNFKLFRENSSFGRLTGKVKTIEDKKNLKDTDILFLDIDDRDSLVKYFSLFEKVGAVIGYSSMTTLLAHHDIFRQSKENYEQVPLVLIHKNERQRFLNLVGKTITLNFKLNIASKK